MEQSPQYWMWDNNHKAAQIRPHIMSLNNNNSSPSHHHLYLRQPPAPPLQSCSSYEDSWEEQAFAEDAAGAGGLGGCIWPPRSYSCTFCRREFRSAQALGGHMNVHRRDRARLKQSPTSPTGAADPPPINHHQQQQVPNPPSSSSVGYQFQLNPCRQILPTNRDFTCINIIHSPNPSPDPPSPRPRVSADNNSCSEKSFFPSAAEEEQMINRKRPHGSFSNSPPPPPHNPAAAEEENNNYKRRNSRADHLSAVSLNLVLQRSSSQPPTSEVDVAAEEEEAEEEVARFKRRRIEEDGTTTASLGGLPFMLTGLNSTPRRRQEVFEIGASCLREELDLELRLGDRPPPKVKTI